MPTNEPQSIVLDVPDYLLTALEKEEEVGSTDIFVQNAASTITARRIEIGQRTGKFSGEYGKIIIHDGKGTDNMEVVDYIDFLLLDYLIVDQLTAEDWMKKDPQIAAGLGEGYTARTLWQTTNTGSRTMDDAKPACTSSNGLTAWPSYRNTEIQDYRTGKTVKIGVRVDAEGNEVQVANTCIGCPLAKEVVQQNPDGTTTWHRPLCRQTPVAVLYDIERKEILTMKAVNIGMAFAFQGHTGKSGRLWNGETLNGIRYPFSYIAGADLDVNGTRIATFRNRPMGKPSPSNPQAPVYAVRMTVTQNNFTPSTAIPQFTVLDGRTSRVKVIDFTQRPANVKDGNAFRDMEQRQLTIEEYIDYLKKKEDVYTEGNWRNRMMASALITNEALAPAPALPSGDADAGTYDTPF